MATGTMMSRVLGLLRDMAFAAMFNNTVKDAWAVAFRLPNMLRRLLGEGSLAVSFIPVFVDARAQDPTGQRAQNLVNGFYTFLLVILGTVTALGILYSPEIVALMVEAPFKAIPGKFELTVHMARIMFIFIFFMSTYAYFMGILNALGSFALPAMAPTLFNVAMIIANFVPTSWQKVEGDALAWGVTIGGFLQTVILVPALIKKGYFPRLSWQAGNRDIRKVYINMLPGILGSGLLQIMTFVNTKFVAEFGEGANTYIYFADRLLELPLSLVSVSIGTALLPLLAGFWEKGQKDKLIESSNFYLRLNLFVAIPAAIGLYALSGPIVDILFVRGKFTAADALVTTSILEIYAFLLISSSSVRVFVPVFYAIKNTWLPALISAVCLLAHLIAAPVLMKHFGIQGLVFSTLGSATLNLILLLLCAHFLIGSFQMSRVFSSLLKFALPSGALWVVTQLYQTMLPEEASRILKIGLLLGVIGLSVLVFTWISKWMKLEEYNSSVGTILLKIQRKLARR